MYKADEGAARLPIYLLEPTMNYPVQDLYVKQHLRRIDPSRKPEQDKASQSDDKHIKYATDILDFKDDENCKGVFVSAEAGYGKSSLCAHLVSLWCNAHPGCDTCVASNDYDLEHCIQAMKKFKLLFYINLRDEDLSCDPPDGDEISALIYKQHQLESQGYSSDYIVQECMKDKSTLVVMDSLDECKTKRLPNRGKHNHSCIVTTSRPWKLESLRSKIHENCYQHVEIVGLEETSPQLLVKKSLDILNEHILEKGKGKKDGSQFLEQIKSEGLQDFLCIPMLIIQMLMLWFDEKPFGNSQSEIYANVIHHQIEVAVKNKKLDLPEHKGESKLRQEYFPLFCKESGCDCKKCEELLLKVAALAFSMLFQENREKCLSFDSSKKPFEGLTKGEVDVCLKIGLFSEHKLFKGMTGGERKAFSFPHKTNQEYFAAVYLFNKWSETVKTNLSSIIKDLDRAMELDKVLLFCSELKPEVASELSDLISVRADGDSRVQEYRQSGEYGDDAPNSELINEIQNIVFAAVQQNIKISSPQQTAQESHSQQPAVASEPSTQDRSSSTPKLILADIILEEPQWPRTKKDRRLVEALDMAAVKSVHIDAEMADVTIWKQAPCLQTFVVENGKETKVENLHGVVVRNQATLRTLGLHGDIDSRLDLSPLENKLAEMLTCDLDLTCLLLNNVKLSHEQCEILCRHLSTSQNLRRLTLSEMTFSHEQCEILCRHLSTTQNLRQLTLDEIKCRTHRGEGWVDAGCCDVKLHSKLELLKLDRLPFNRVSFPADDLKTCEIALDDNVPAETSAISCLTSASNLREFRCWGLRDVASSLELAAVLPRLHGLQRIDLNVIDFGCLRETRLSVAAAKTLESVKLYNSTITADGLESLVQSVDAPRVEIRLYRVTIRDGDPREFLQRLRDSRDVEVKEDKGVKYEGWEVLGFYFYKNKQ